MYTAGNENTERTQLPGLALWWVGFGPICVRFSCGIRAIVNVCGDSLGLNAAVRGVGKSVIHNYGMGGMGFEDEFRGLVEDWVRVQNSMETHFSPHPKGETLCPDDAVMTPVSDAA